MKQIHIIYGSVLAALLAIVPTIVLAQTEVPPGLSIASVNVSQDPITRGSDQEVSVAVVDNSADAPADGVDVMLTVSYASGMETTLTESTDQNGNADFVFPIGASSKPGTFNIVAEIPGSNISEDESFEVIPTTSGVGTTGSRGSGSTTIEGDSEVGTTGSRGSGSTTSGGSTTSEGDSERSTTSGGSTTGSTN
jgi:5-hydroxyisourate hydrolase-like protein (transthyretin family)